LKLRADRTAAYYNGLGLNTLPGLFGLETLRVSQGELAMRLEIKPQFLAPNGFLHAATIIALADSCCGYACSAHLPEGALNFTTIELKTKFLGTARSGTLESIARAIHLGRTTHVWDAAVTQVGSEKPLALFRCTQMILWPKASTGTAREQE
jgi:1,4-dihydroxy-2-naphthoyl-CoA hydrolase